MNTIIRRCINQAPAFGATNLWSTIVKIPSSSFHAGRYALGLEEFLEVRTANETSTNGRAWTPSDLRKKSFDDLHKLWYVLYKERNLLLTEREKTRRLNKHTPVLEENRYRNVKRSMANIKFVLTERDTIEKLVKENCDTNVSAGDDAGSVASSVEELTAPVSRYSAVAALEATKAANRAERMAARATGVSK